MNIKALNFFANHLKISSPIKKSSLIRTIFFIIFYGKGFDDYLHFLLDKDFKDRYKYKDRNSQFVRTVHFSELKYI